MRPTDFAAQLNVSLANGWGIVRTVTDMCMKMPEGKYVLVKDPNKVRSLITEVQRIENPATLPSLVHHINFYIFSAGDPPVRCSPFDFCWRG